MILVYFQKCDSLFLLSFGLFFGLFWSIATLGWPISAYFVPFTLKTSLWGGGWGGGLWGLLLGCGSP